jgi:hypothetical protein
MRLVGSLCRSRLQRTPKPVHRGHVECAHAASRGSASQRNPTGKGLAFPQKRSTQLRQAFPRKRAADAAMRYVQDHRARGRWPSRLRVVRRVRCGAPRVWARWGRRSCCLSWPGAGVGGGERGEGLFRFPGHVRVGGAACMLEDHDDSVGGQIKVAVRVGGRHPDPVHRRYRPPPGNEQATSQKDVTTAATAVRSHDLAILTAPCDRCPVSAVQPFGSGPRP